MWFLKAADNFNPVFIWTQHFFFMIMFPVSKLTYWSSPPKEFPTIGDASNKEKVQTYFPTGFLHKLCFPYNFWLIGFVIFCRVTLSSYFRNTLSPLWNTYESKREENTAWLQNALSEEVNSPKPNSIQKWALNSVMKSSNRSFMVAG